MKKLLFATMVCIVTAFAVQAQQPVKNNSGNNNVTQEDYERMLRNERQMDFREYTIQTLGLTKEQIKEFDPVYRDYMREKNELAGKKVDLLEKYSEEIAEENTAEKKDEEVGDFVEDFWEIEIKEMELKKDYFDKLEDKITADHAFAFFMLEDIAESDIERRYIEKRYVPIIIEVEKSGANAGAMNKGIPEGSTNLKKPIDAKYKADIEVFSNWVQNRNEKVGLDHQYTHDGLMKLTAAITALSNACEGTLVNMADKRNRVMQIAKDLQKDPKSTQHADWAREAFIASADMMKSVQQKCSMNASQTAVNQVDEAARKIDPNQLMTPQAQHIYYFFQKAQMAIDNMANSVTWATKD